MRGSRGVRPAASLVGLVLSLLPRSPHAFHQRCCAPGLRGQGGGSGRGRCEQQPPPSPARSAAPRRRLALWPGQLPPHDPGANFAGWRGLHAATWPRRWGLPAHAATPAGGSGWEEDAEVFDWGPPSKEEIVYEARLAERDDVPTWARAMVLGGKPVQVRSFRGREFPAYLLADAFDLTKANMEEMYLRSIWGWNEAQKRTDLESPMARFFVATDERGRLQGFIHYRFELVDNKFTHESSSAAYVLELQVIDSVRRLGLGTLLMKAVEEIAIRTQMDSTMLCVFRYNEPAVDFYLNKMGYEVDQSSAFNDNQHDVWELVKLTPSASQPNSKEKLQLQ